MSEEELERLKSLIAGNIVVEEQNGFGMANVEKRLQMQYGAAYGIKVDSTLDEGTTVTVRIPKQ